MALSDRLDSTPQRAHGLPCSVGALLDKLEADAPAEYTALNDMLYVRGWSAQRIYDAVTAEGHDVAHQTVNRHRSRACRCYKATR